MPARLCACGLTLTTACALTSGLLRAQETPKPYVPHAAVQGTIRTWGSPQMLDLLHQYETAFGRFQPGVVFDDDLRSTITAVAGVYTGRADIGLLGREIWPTEAQAFASIERRPPLVIDVATGSYNVPKATFALMVFVPRANPIAKLSLPQLGRLFSQSADRVRTWGQLGLRGAWASRPVHLYGFAIDNDKSQIFAQLVFPTGAHWSAALHESVNAGKVDAGEDILRRLAADPDGIAISNVFYATPAVRALPLSNDTSSAAVAPSTETVADHTWPLTRDVSFVLDADVSHPLSPAVQEFLRFVLSADGAQAVRAEGNYLPLPPALAAHELQLLDAIAPGAIVAK